MGTLAHATDAFRLRPIVQADHAFLRRVYIASRDREMSRSGWPAPAIEAFLGEQFELQHRYYQEHFPDGDFAVIERGVEAIGRLYANWSDTKLQLIDIALLPQWRGAGIGTALLDDLLARVDRSGLATGLHVETDNPARRLYRRLGFEVVGDNGIYLQMSRPARAGGAASRAEPWQPSS